MIDPSPVRLPTLSEHECSKTVICGHLLRNHDLSFALNLLLSIRVAKHRLIIRCTAEYDDYRQFQDHTILPQLEKIPEWLRRNTEPRQSTNSWIWNSYQSVPWECAFLPRLLIPLMRQKHSRIIPFDGYVRQTYARCFNYVLAVYPSLVDSSESVYTILLAR